MSASSGGVVLPYVFAVVVRISSASGAHLLKTQLMLRNNNLCNCSGDAESSISLNMVVTTPRLSRALRPTLPSSQAQLIGNFQCHMSPDTKLHNNNVHSKVSDHRRREGTRAQKGEVAYNNNGQGAAHTDGNNNSSSDEEPPNKRARRTLRRVPSTPEIERITLKRRQ